MHSFPKIKFLLVDDLAENLAVLEALLRRDDLEILSARSGTEALELLLVHDFALAFIDVQMPGMDGFELAELMRGADRSKHIPIIFVTAGSREKARVFRGYESGAVDFIFKPVDPDMLRQKADIFFDLYRQRQLLAEQLDRIQASENLLRGIMDSSAAMIFVKDLQGRYVSLNASFEKCFDIARGSFIGRSDADLLPAETVQALRENDRQVIERGDAMQFEEKILHKDGEHTYVSSKVPLRDATGKVWGICGVATDITKRKRLELDLAQAVQTREDILAVVSHDLRNPLNVIDLTVTLLKQSASAKDERTLAQYGKIERAAGLMQRMIGDLMDMANIRAGRLSIEKQPESVQSIASEALAAHELSAREKRSSCGAICAVMRACRSIESGFCKSFPTCSATR
jgi:PAS domain S-box-containing protein